MAKCKAKTKAGKPCQNRPMTDSAYCWFHNPAVSEQRAEARRKGGRSRAVGRQAIKPVELDELTDILRGLAETIAATWMQDNTPSRSRALIAGYREAREILIAIGLDERVENLERIAGVGGMPTIREVIIEKPAA
jgi:hypothetical protein